MMSRAVAWGGAGGTWAPPTILTGRFDLVSGHAFHAALRFNVFISIQSVKIVYLWLQQRKIKPVLNKLHYLNR